MGVGEEFVLCCLTPEERREVDAAIENRDYRPVYDHQRKLVQEKHGWRCGECGAFYPFLRIRQEGRLTDPNRVSKLKKRPEKYKKAADIFCGDHYYARSKKTLLKFEADADGAMAQTAAIPIPGEVYQLALSRDERLLATETFSGTIAVIDMGSGQILAKKRSCKTNGAFRFTQDGALLYFSESAVRRWDLAAGAETVLWSAAEGTVCTHALTGREGVCIFQCTDNAGTLAVVVREDDSVEAVRLPKVPALAKLAYLPEREEYTLVTKDRVCVFDAGLGLTEEFPFPELLRISAGGGFFPVTAHGPSGPQRVFLSPDGRWALLDYFTAAIVMERESRKIAFCLFSYTGRTAQHMGFSGDRKFWYTWGDSTYIQELEDTP